MRPNTGADTTVKAFTFKLKFANYWHIVEVKGLILQQINQPPLIQSYKADSEGEEDSDVVVAAEFLKLDLKH